MNVYYLEKQGKKPLKDERRTKKGSQKLQIRKGPFFRTLNFEILLRLSNEGESEVDKFVRNSEVTNGYLTGAVFVGKDSR